MKLLLVEDEELTREGVKRVIPWERLGITELKTAEDGEEGLRTALEFAPDLVLTDIRMPHMDGITMAFAIRKHLAHCRFIFMSGYSDKEYLLSAIQLSALNYLEKPIEPEEVERTIERAVALIQEDRERRRIEEEYRNMLKIEMEPEPDEDLVPADWQANSGLAEKVEHYIDGHFMENNLSLTLIADTFHLSRQYLCWAFKKQKGCTINQFMITKRLDWAKEYIGRHPECKIKDVAVSSGFTDSNYFIKVFKKSIGVTPMEYRERPMRGRECEGGDT